MKHIAAISEIVLIAFVCLSGTTVLRVEAAYGSCSVYTYGGEGQEGATCVFPFTYNGTTYDRCLSDGRVFITPWCATTDNWARDGEWGYCKPCVATCDGVADCDYQSCQGCDVYATCTNGALIDGRPCPAGLVWNDVGKYCDYTSPTCPAPTVTQTRYLFPLGTA